MILDSYSLRGGSRAVNWRSIVSNRAARGGSNSGSEFKSAGDAIHIYPLAGLFNPRESSVVAPASSFCGVFAEYVAARSRMGTQCMYTRERGLTLA